MRNWESGRFTVSADVSVTEITMSLMEYRQRANNFRSSAFNVVWN